MRLVVDGEAFDVRERPDEPGHFDCDWLSGPNPGYGFSCAFFRARPLGTEAVTADARAELERAITSFLRGIDPSTGYLAD